MAAADPLDREIGAFEGAVFLKSFDSVMGARGIKAAVLGDDGAEGPLIETDEKNQDCFHIR